MDLIGECLQRYAQDFQRYAEVARAAAMRLEAHLDEAGVRAIVTHRAKHPGRLEEKLRKRATEKSYASVDQMYGDVVDLAGVRVALYFPGDRELVGSVIKQNFVEIEPAREFPAAAHAGARKKFSGYAATHYRVRLQPAGTAIPHSSAPIEIQVASVLMHSWAEVEHDLAYKPTQGGLSPRELALLDQLNGLVLAGEIALEQLQAAGQERVGELHRAFRSHYDLAAHLIERAESEYHLTGVPEEGLGRVDLLFELLRSLGLGTPNSIAPYLRHMHSDLDRRPLAEQVIDAVLAEDGSRYSHFADIRSERANTSGAQPEPPQFDDVSRFMTEWIRLEKFVQPLLQGKTSSTPPVPEDRSLAALGLLDEDESVQFDQLRRLRNMTVHRFEMPSHDVLRDATTIAQLLIERLSKAQDREAGARQDG